MHELEGNKAIIVSNAIKHHKLLYTLAIIIMMLLLICSCASKDDGIWTTEVESRLYSQEDISQAMDVVKTEFKKEYSTFTLEELYYAGDDTSKGYQDWADKNDSDEVIVFISTFVTDDQGGPDKLFSANATESGWQWILVRNRGEKWKIVSWGY